MIDATKLTTTVTYTPTTTAASPNFVNYYRAGETITVRLSYVHPLFFGMLKRNDITLRATSSMRIEPGGARSVTP
jgi:hypothetical protein